MIVSTDFIKSDRRRHERLRSRPELVIVDEAHTCTDPGTETGVRYQRHRLVAEIAADPDRMETFPIVNRKDEKAHGEFRTKRVILETYGAMAEAIRTGEPYRTALDPPPGDRRAAHEDG